MAARDGFMRGGGMYFNDLSTSKYLADSQPLSLVVSTYVCHLPSTYKYHHLSDLHAVSLISKR